MDRARHLRNYDLHSWTGITLGLIVYVVALTGCFALFDNEIRTWEDPALRVPVPAVAEQAPMDEVFTTWMEETSGGAELEFLRFDYPSTYAPYYLGMMQIHDENDEHVFEEQRWDARTGAPIAMRGDGLGIWLLDFHRDFMWPDGLGGRTVGRSLVGIVGIILMLAILSGIIAHTKIREEAYSMRLKRSQRLKWQDSHKVVGIWGLPFYVMIAFTGAFLGVVVIVSQLIAAIAFKGDLETLVDAVLGPGKTPTGEQVQMLTVDELRAFQHPESGEAPAMLIFANYGDAAAEIDVYYTPDTELTTFEVLAISGATGEPITDDPYREITPANRVTNSIAPLHYGTFGGIWLKLLYFVLGLSLAVITALGCMMWIERRKHGNEGTKSEGFYNRLGHLNTGVIMGLPLATMAIFYLDKLYLGAEAGRLAATGWTYFAAWFAGLGYALVRRNDYATTRELLMGSGALALFIPALNGAVTGDWFISALASDHTVSAWVDVSMAVLGVSTIVVAYVLPQSRSDKVSRRAEAELAPAE
ncbi:MAG: PepSY-associated TM helix domain-containing protein [Pseudomonadota bacterium]